MAQAEWARCRTPLGRARSRIDGAGGRASRLRHDQLRARPHLVKSYEGMEPPGFDGHVHTGTVDEDDNAEHVALRWVMKRGINLRGFEIELEYNYGTVIGAGMLVVLMSKGNVWHDMKLRSTFAARGKTTDLNAFQYGVRTALCYASREGHLDILKALIAAGANKDKTDGSGTPLVKSR